MNLGKNCKIAGGSTFRLIPDFMPSKKTWRDYQTNIVIGVLLFVGFVAVALLAEYQLRKTFDCKGPDGVVRNVPATQVEHGSVQ